MKKRLFTGLQPSGDLHIGNYFGALKPFLDIYEEYESFLMVADYHALTSVRDSEVLRKNIYNIVRDYLACGLDTEKAVIFRQSDNPHHTEMGWVLNCMVTVPFLMQAHSYKDKINKGMEANAGLFTYPMLMAADIVLYDTDIVPVGEDQRQHLEYTREVVGKFNRAYGDILKSPKEKILDSVGIISGTDGSKMSKSYGNTIPLFADLKEIEKAVMSIVTNSGDERPENIYAIHRLIKNEADLEIIYNNNIGMYGNLKKILIEDLNKFIKPLRERRDLITDDQVREVLSEGAGRAKEVSTKTLKQVRDAIGINL